MPITDLTGTTWLINNYLGFGDGIFATTFNLTFTSNNKNYTQFYTNDEGTSESWIFEISYATSNNEWDNVYFYRVYDGEDYDTTQWIDQTYRTITITGGTDATNSNLIAWLQANATQQTAPTPTTQIALGRAFIKQAVENKYYLTWDTGQTFQIYVNNTLLNTQGYELQDGDIIDIAVLASAVNSGIVSVNNSSPPNSISDTDIHISYVQTGGGGSND